MPTRRMSALGGLALVCLVFFSSFASGQTPHDSKPLVVGTHPIAPFVIHNPDGTWSGIIISKRGASRTGLTAISPTPWPG